MINPESNKKDIVSYYLLGKTRIKGFHIVEIPNNMDWYVNVKLFVEARLRNTLFL